MQFIPLCRGFCHKDSVTSVSYNVDLRTGYEHLLSRPQWECAKLKDERGEEVTTHRRKPVW